MITQLGQVKLYVDNQDECKAFWTEKLGFEVISEEVSGPMRWIEEWLQRGRQPALFFIIKNSLPK